MMLRPARSASDQRPIPPALQSVIDTDGALIEINRALRRRNLRRSLTQEFDAIENLGIDSTMARGIAFALGKDPPLGSYVKGFCTPLSVSPVDVIDGDLTFADLLKTIIKTKATDFLLVVHGILGGSGLYLPIAKGAPNVTGQRLEILLQVASGKSLSDRQAPEFGPDPKVVSELLDLMKKVRAMNLNTVEWRACDMGKKPDVLTQFRIFFGAKLMGAPAIENNFGVASVNILAINKIPERFWKEFNRYDYPKINTKVTYFLKLDPSTRWPVEGAIFAESMDDLKAWIQQKMNSKGTVPDRSMFMHHLWKEPDKSHGLDPPTPILPLEDEYKSNIGYVRG
jgi:hypothetical protein